MGQSTWGFVAQRSSPGYIHPAITEKKTEIDSPSTTTFNMKCLVVLLLSAMTVVMGSAEPIYSDGYPFLCYDNLLGGDTYQVLRWPWPATYVAEPKFPLQREPTTTPIFLSTSWIRWTLGRAEDPATTSISLWTSWPTRTQRIRWTSGRSWSFRTFWSGWCARSSGVNLSNI